MKVPVCGRTGIRGAEKLNDLLEELHGRSAITCLANGGARGIDLLASQWAQRTCITVKSFKIDTAPTAEAFCTLNDKMLNEESPDLVLAIDPGPISDDLTRKATGRKICIGKRKVNLSRVFAGQKVGIREVADNIWLVSFMDYDLGFFDQDESRVEPAPNPFIPKLLPMSSV